MRPYISTPRLVIAALVATKLVSVAAGSARTTGVYAQPRKNRPLEVPPDLDLPRTDAVVGAPVTASAMAPAAPVASASAPSGFTIAGTRDDIFNKVGEALAGVEGLTIASRAQLLGAYDVAYEGSNFLVRVSAVEAGVYISAVDPADCRQRAPGRDRGVRRSRRPVKVEYSAAFLRALKKRAQTAPVFLRMTLKSAFGRSSFTVLPPNPWHSRRS